MERLRIKVMKVRREQPTRLPSYATPGSAGVDLHASLEEAWTINPGQIMRIPTGIAIELPNPHIGAFIYARSGLASKHGLTLANGVGVIDSDYRGEIQVAVINLGTEPVTLQDGDRIAQMVFMPIYLAEFQWADGLDDTARGSGGFGSTGVHL